MVNHKAITAFLTYKASEEWPKRGTEWSITIQKWPFKSWPDTLPTGDTIEKKQG